jgi:hypothetical protein
LNIRARNQEILTVFGEAKFPEKSSSISLIMTEDKYGVQAHGTPNIQIQSFG